MKLFRGICARVFAGMAMLSGCILLFLLSSMLQQSIADAGAYGAEEMTSRLYLMHDFIQRENAGLLGDAAWDALIDSKFREVFGTRGVLWKDGREVHNASPYVYDRRELEALCKDDARTSGSLLVSSPQRVEERWQIVFYKKEAKRLSRLSQKMSKLTGLYAQGANEIALGQTRVGPLLRRLLSTMEVPLTEKKAKFLVTWETEELEKRMDADLVLSLLHNLVDNACKASGEGGRILVAADIAKLSVQDFGKGIPKSDLARVTEAFYMVDKSRVKKQGGMGLGLALCSQIAHLHGWEMCIESEEGAGTKVSVFW